MNRCSASNQLRRVLVIAYAFPPCGGAGVQRTAKFVRYLPEHGWLPTVLTVDPSCYGVQDESHTATLPPDVEVIRTWHFDPVARFSRTDATANGHQAGGTTRALKLKPLLASSLRTVARNGWVGLERNVLIPDQGVLWYPRAVAAGRAALGRRRFDLIYATGEPYSAYFVARTLSQMSSVPFVIDMRDPWTLAPYRTDRRSSFRQKVEQEQERRILESCAACIFANRSIDFYKETFPGLAHKFHYIPNGYDSADFIGVSPRRFDRFTIVHSGTFLPGYRTADTFLKALRSLLDRDSRLPEKLQVVFVGKTGEERKQIEELGLGSIVSQTGYLPHQVSLSYLLGADALLLVGGKHRWEETGKIYEYFASGKQILGLLEPRGVAADLLHRYPRSLVVNREDVAEAARAIQKVLDSPATADCNAGQLAARFERSSLTAELAGILKTSAGDGSGYRESAIGGLEVTSCGSINVRS